MSHASICGLARTHRLVTVQSSGELTTRNTVASSGALGLVHRSHRDQGVPWMVCGPGGEIVGGERLVSVGLARAADSGIRGILDRVHRGELNWGMGKPGRKRRTNAKIGRLRVVTVAIGLWSDRRTAESGDPVHLGSARAPAGPAPAAAGRARD